MEERAIWNSGSVERGVCQDRASLWGEGDWCRLREGRLTSCARLLWLIAIVLTDACVTFPTSDIACDSVWQDFARV